MIAPEEIRARYGDTKRCSRCKTDCAIDQFCLNRAGKMALDSRCRACHRERGRARNKELARINEGKEVVRDGTKWCSDCRQHIGRIDFFGNRTSPDGLAAICKLCTRVRSVKGGARTRAYLMHLSDDQIRSMALSECHYCGEPGTAATPHGVDRMDNSGHYTEANSVPCCKVCNLMKGKVPAGEFVAHAAKIVAYQGTLTNHKGLG